MKNNRIRIISVGILALAITVILLGMVALPRYNIYRREMSGRAQLAEAEWSRQIAVKEAQAVLDSAKLLGDAEIERAKGVAEANSIIGGSLKGNQEYIWYLWIQGLHDGNSEVIYVATESNLPILEANRLK